MKTANIEFQNMGNVCRRKEKKKYDHYENIAEARDERRRRGATILPRITKRVAASRRVVISHDIDVSI